jgi:hypothetical protein
MLGHFPLNAVKVPIPTVAAWLAPEKTPKPVNAPED